MRNYLLSFLILSTFSCSEVVDTEYFNGTIKEVSLNIEPKKAVVENKFTYDKFENSPFLYDSLIIGQISRTYNSKFFFSIINQNTGESLGDFCPKGNAGNELSGADPINKVFHESNELKTFILDYNKNRLYKWNISKSIKNNTTVFDTIVKFEFSSKNKQYLYFKPINDSTLLVHNQSYLVNRKHHTLPELGSLKTREIFSPKVHKTYHIFKKNFEDKKSSFFMSHEERKYMTFADKFFYSDTEVRPDGKYVVQSMWCLAQLNILNLETGEIKGFRMKDTPNFSIFKNPKYLKWYFCAGLCVTNDRIFVGYSGGERKGQDNSSYVYEYNWDGEILNIYDVGMGYDNLRYNEITNKLYLSRTVDEGELYQLSIDVL